MVEMLQSGRGYSPRKTVATDQKMRRVLGFNEAAGIPRGRPRVSDINDRDLALQ